MTRSAKDRCGVFAAAGVVLVGILCLSSASAMAAKVHAFSGSFGAATSNPANPQPLAMPEAVAVDNSADGSNGDVYVADTGNHRIEKFDAEGQLIFVFGKGVDQTTSGDICTVVSLDTCGPGAAGTEPGEIGAPAFIAVDDSSGPSAGDVYVGDPTAGTITKFTAAGALIAVWKSGGQIAGFSELSGITVDGAGVLYALATTSEAAIFEFGQDGTVLGEPFVLGPRGTSPRGIAVDNGGFIYKVTGSPNVERYSSTGTDLGQVDEREDATGVAIDPADGGLYVSQEAGFINRFAENCPLENCTPVESFGEGSISHPAGLSVNAADGSVYVALPESGTVAILREGELPEAVTKPASNVALHSATLKGVAGPAEGGEVVDCHFEIGTTTEYSLGSFPCEQSTPIDSSTPVTASLSGLVNDTTYHYRLVTANAKLPASGEDETFTTPHAVDQLAPIPATDITGTSATIGGSWIADGEETHYRLEWGFTTLYEHQTPLEAAGDSGLGAVKVEKFLALSELGPATTYHYRIVATNGKGTSHSADETFKTLTYPVLLARQTSGLTATNTQLHALVEPEGGTVSACSFEYGLAAGEYTEGAVPCEPSLPYTSSTVVSAKVQGLSPGTTYHYRVSVVDQAGERSEADQSFETAPLLPEIEGAGVSAPSSTGVEVSAVITPGFGQTLYFFEYGESLVYGQGTSPQGPLAADGEVHSVAAQLAGLTPNRTYHVRAVAVNFAGTTHGPDLTFSTLGPPQIVSSVTSEVGATGVTLKAEIRPSRASTTFHIDFGSGSSLSEHSAESAPIGADALIHEIESKLTGLTSNTTYHYRVVASNEVGTTRGIEGTFTTLPSAEIEHPAENGEKCKPHFVKRHGRCVRKPKTNKHKKHGRGHANA